MNELEKDYERKGGKRPTQGVSGPLVATSSIANSRRGKFSSRNGACSVEKNGTKDGRP